MGFPHSASRFGWRRAITGHAAGPHTHGVRRAVRRPKGPLVPWHAAAGDALAEIWASRARKHEVAWRRFGWTTQLPPASSDTFCYVPKMREEISASANRLQVPALHPPDKPLGAAGRAAAKRRHYNVKVIEAPTLRKIKSGRRANRVRSKLERSAILLLTVSLQFSSRTKS